MFLLLVLLAAQSNPAQQAPPSEAASNAQASVYVPARVYDTRHKSLSDFEAMIADLARADVVLVGEQHDDPNTHRLETAILQALHRRGVAVTVSLEMFERDVQAIVDGYLNGTLTEAEFLAQSRPWPRYSTDYRSLVETAKANGWKVIASNVPRRLASTVSKSGLASLESLPAEERSQVARAVECPLDDYFKRFAETMNSHPMPGSDSLAADERAAITERYYFAQCVKDETMAESIVAALERGQGERAAVVHYNGAFHSDFGAGVVQRVRRRAPGKRVVIVSVLPVEDIDTIAPTPDDVSRADYLLYTVR
jgi:uncharacterized iron-regulated protein